MDVVAAEEVAGVIEQQLVVVVVVVEERHLERAGVGLERPRHEGADDEALGDESRVRGRRQVVAMAHQRPDVAHVDARDAQITVPAGRIQRVETGK
jgi:hypothetical protein